MKKTLEILKQARFGGYAIGAFNAANNDTLKAIVAAAKKNNVPVIIEASKGEIDSIGMKQMVALVNVYRGELNNPVILNLDHAPSFEYCKNAIDCGFDYVHIDGSKLPYEENLAITKQVVEYAHAHDVIVEGEMDHIQGSSADHTGEDPSSLAKPEFMTNPEKAKEFVESTGVDVFASFIGNLHGVYSREMHLDFDLLIELTEILPNTLFSLHGGSGIADEDVKKAIKLGIVKINVNSEMRIAYKAALKDSLNTSDEIAIYKLTPKAVEAVQNVVEGKMHIFKNNQN